MIGKAIPKSIGVQTWNESNELNDSGSFSYTPTIPLVAWAIFLKGWRRNGRSDIENLQRLMELMIFITNHFFVFSKIFTPPKNSRIAPEKGHNFEKGEISSEPVPSIFRGNFRRRPLKPKDLENQPDAQMQIFFRWTLVVLKCMGSNHYEPKRQI